LWEEKIIRQEVIEFRSLPKQVVAIGNHGYIILNTSARRKEIQVILDSGAQGNFISLEIIKQLNILIREKKKPYLFSIIDRTAIKQDKGIIKHKTILIRVKIRGHVEEISLDIVRISNHQVIFSVPWIR
jgi:hypothetical protein